MHPVLVDVAVDGASVTLRSYVTFLFLAALVAIGLAGRVLVMTGGPRDAGLAAWVGQFASARVLAKPIETDKLLGAIDVLLRSRV